MQLAEKQELVRLLNLYQADLLMDNDNNIREAAKHSGKKWEGTYKTGVKAQYKHLIILCILIFPFVVLADLLKMNK